MAILGKRQPKKGEGPSEERILDVTASMQGSLAFQEPVSLRISGRFEGTLETRGTLAIGERAVVQADITGDEISIAGRVTGKVVAKQMLKLLSTAALEGEAWTPVFQVEPGARVNGTIHMEAAAEVWMTTAEVAEYLEVERRLVEQWAREGRIPAVQETDQWQFKKAKIDEWVASQKSS